MFPAAPVEPLVFFVLFFYILFVYSLGCCLHHTCEVFRLWTVSVLLMLLLKGRADALYLDRRHLNLLLDSAPLSSFSSESEANQFFCCFFCPAKPRSAFISGDGVSAVVPSMVFHSLQPRLSLKLRANVPTVQCCCFFFVRRL